MECSFRVYVDGVRELDMKDVFDTVISLFNHGDLIFMYGYEARLAMGKSAYMERTDHDFDEPDYPIVLARQSVKDLRDKLWLLGYGKGGTKRIFDYLKRELIASNTRSIELHGETSDPSDDTIIKLRAENEALAILNYDDWFSSVTRLNDDISELAHKLLYHYEDELLILSALVYGMDESKIVEFDFTDMYEYVDEFESAAEEYDSKLDMPIIVTEGTTDIEFIREAISILKPHLARYMRFLETDFKPETNADAILKMAKSFAAAGMKQNMLFVLDNDSAAANALASFKTTLSTLPDNFRVTQYPSVSLLESYPTKGPQGDVSLDVNGTSGSIELYLGRDVLADETGNMYPVQWRGYVEKVKAYQGAVLEKRSIQDAFRQKYKSIHGGSAIRSEDWTEMEVLLSHIIKELSRMPAIHPSREFDGF